MPTQPSSLYPAHCLTVCAVCNLSAPAFTAKDTGRGLVVHHVNAALCITLGIPAYKLVGRSLNDVFQLGPQAAHAYRSGSVAMLVRARDRAYWTRLSTVEFEQPEQLCLGVVRQFPIDAEDLALSGKSPASMLLTEHLSSAAHRDSPVVLTGEPYTWKRHYAQAIYQASRWAEGPLHRLSGVSATPEDLTIAALSGGTILLADLDEAPLNLQEIVLALLDTPDLRFLFTSKTSLLDVSRRGVIRRSLAARLANTTIHVPPLRERLTDVPMMAQQLAEELTPQTDRLGELSDKSLKRMALHPWLGNRAELRQTVQRAISLARGSVLEVRPRQSWAPRKHLVQPLDDAIRDAIRNALTQTEWTIEGPNGAAEVLGIAPSTLRSKMKKLNIQR